MTVAIWGTGITVRRNGVVVLRDINFEVREAEVVCLLGPNGCGKTTLLKSLLGVLRAERGEAYIDDVPISSLKPADIAKQVGMVFQDHVAYFPYSVLEVAVMGRAPHLGLFAAPSATDFSLAEEALHAVGIAHLRDRPYTQLSGGERQLVLIARTLTQAPKIILLDEPTAHLDFGNQLKLLARIAALAQERGMTILFTSHYPNHALWFSDKTLLMKEGRLAAIGRPSEVITEENLALLYGVRAKVMVDADGTLGGARYVVPLSID